MLKVHNNYIFDYKRNYHVVGPICYIPWGGGTTSGMNTDDPTNHQPTNQKTYKQINKQTNKPIVSTVGFV